MASRRPAGVDLVLWLVVGLCAVVFAALGVLRVVRSGAPTAVPPAASVVPAVPTLPPLPAVSEPAPEPIDPATVNLDEILL